jgi:Ca2+-binding RTX toxin-like protein
MSIYYAYANGSATIAGAAGDDTLSIDYSAATTAVTMSAPTLTGPVIAGYPAPGGTSFTSNGINAANGIREVTYSGFNSGSYHSLWWGPAAVGAAMDGSINSLQENLSLQSGFGVDGKTATWTGSTTINSIYGIQVVYTKFIATLTGGDGEWHNASDVGLTGGPSAVADVDPSTGFKVQYSFLASTDGVNFVSFNTLYNNTPRYVSGQALTSLNGQFVYEDDGQSGVISDTSGNNTHFSGIENFNVIGGSADDIIATGAGIDSIDGGLGADRMAGGKGNDTYYVDNQGDVVTENAGEGIDTVHTTLFNYTLAANTENLIIDGTAALNVFGNDKDNVITGNAGRNVINGGDGNDTLYSNGGDDWLDGNAGADTYYGGSGNNGYVFDNAGDNVLGENADGGTDSIWTFVTISLGANIENLRFSGTGNISGFGNELANVITGNAGNNLIAGNAGNDTLWGKGGNDTFLFSDLGATNKDTIWDFDATDLIMLSGSPFAGLNFAGDHLAATDFVRGSAATIAGHATVIYNAGTGFLSFDADGKGGAAAQDIAFIGKNLGFFDYNDIVHPIPE